MYPLTFPLSNVQLSHSEASGNTSITAGLRPARFHQAPQRSVLPPWHVAYAHPPVRPRVPSPIATRPAPRHPEGCA